MMIFAKQTVLMQQNVYMILQEMINIIQMTDMQIL